MRAPIHFERDISAGDYAFEIVNFGEVRWIGPVDESDIMALNEEEKSKRPAKQEAAINDLRKSQSVRRSRRRLLTIFAGFCAAEIWKPEKRSVRCSRKAIAKAPSA